MSAAADELEKILAAAHQRLDERDARRHAQVLGDDSPPSPAITPTKLLMRERHLRAVR